ncbi:MAG: hypothetical protein U0M15_00530 [Bacillota bacterium]|nr:hypothetical protein [Bacillota bacterium]
MHPTLKNDLKAGNIAHAYLLYGPGETVYQDALSFGLSLNCLSKDEEGIYCGHCRPCRLGLEGCFPDCVVTEPTKALYEVEIFRRWLKNTYLTAQEGNYRVFIVKEADRLGEPSANTFLKTLEEPAKNSVFLLLAENPDKILPTIESRCRILRYREERECKADLGETWRTLASLPSMSVEELFALSEKSAKDKEGLKTFFEEAQQILKENYEAAMGSNTAQYPLPFTEDKLWNLWQAAIAGPMLAEYQVTPRLIAEDFYFAVRNENGGIYGNHCWCPL